MYPVGLDILNSLQASLIVTPDLTRSTKIRLNSTLSTSFHGIPITSKLEDQDAKSVNYVVAQSVNYVMALY
ncbi:MAG: hypothetical protein ACYSWQ_07800, partial [Planctomycetota bacterium]